MIHCKLIGVSQDSKRLHKDTNSNIRCVVPLRKESIRSYLLILFSKSKSNNTNEFSASSLMWIYTQEFYKLNYATLLLFIRQEGAR